VCTLNRYLQLGQQTCLEASIKASLTSRTFYLRECGLRFTVFSALYMLAVEVVREIVPLFFFVCFGD